MSDRLIIFLVSMSPFLELRGSIPLGLAKGLSLKEVFFISIIANIIIIIPLLLFFKFLIRICEKLKFLNKLLFWWFTKIEKKYYLVEKYGFFGLLLFVVIPLPGSGAWSGCLAACLFKVRFFRAFVAIALGVIGAGVLVSIGSLGVFKFYSFLKDLLFF